MCRLFAANLAPICGSWCLNWRALMKAADDFLAGAAYTPADDPHNQPQFYPGVWNDMLKIKKRLSVKEWGR
jgi:hypothetical protein